MQLPTWIVQAAVTTQFFFYGRVHFTKNGWASSSSKYSKPDLLATVDLTDRVVVITGANSGIGKEAAAQLTLRGATVFIVCRDLGKADAVAAELRSSVAGVSGATSPAGLGRTGQVQTFQADVALASDVRRVAREIDAALLALGRTMDAGPHSTRRGLDALVCNAGALLHQRTLTSEGVETTFAAHLAHGTFLLATLLGPSLDRSPDPREPNPTPLLLDYPDPTTLTPSSSLTQ
jgi:dehydrogenase/reductase SDR family protein 12